MPRKIKRDENLRSAAAEQKRLRRAQMTDEERKKLRAVEAERTRQKRAQMTEEEIEKRRARDAAKKREKRLAISGSKKELQQVKAKNAEKYRQKSEKMTEEERQKRNARIAESMRKRRAQMTEEELKQLHAQQSEYHRQKWARKTEEEKRRFKAMQFERRRLKENGTTVEKVRHMISLAAELSRRNPARYETAGTFFKNSFCEILNLHTEVETLRNNFKQTVSDAVKNAVNFHRVGKHSRTVPDVQMENSNEDPTQMDETFKILSKDSSVAGEENSDEINKAKHLECSICSKKFATSLGLTIHQKEHKTNSGEFKCAICAEMFNDCNLMTSHYLQVHSLEFSSLVDDELPSEETDEELERYKSEFEFLFTRKCLICFQTFEMQRLGLSTYSQHVITHHSENKELLKNFTYICSFCEKPHTLQHALEYHWKTLCFEKWQNENHNNGEIVCENCGLKFSNEESLSSHVKVFHLGKKKVSCELCGKEVISEATLKMHIKVIHEGEYKFTCEQCGKSFKLRQTLLKHTKSVHLGVKPFSCKFCSKQFVNKGNLTAHENNHTGDKPYKCKHCDKTFPGRSALQVHASSHEQKSNLRLTCEICGKTLSPKSMASHKRYAHGDAQNSNFVCNICGKVYKAISSFKDHKYSHDGLKRFGCSLCEQTFTQKNHYHNHTKRTHANQNAQMLKLISEEEVPSNVNSNIIIPTYNENAGTYGTPAETAAAISNISNFSLEPQDPSKTVSVGNNVAASEENDALPSAPLCSSFIDFSRANVPLVSSTSTEDASDANIENPEEQQYNVYMENSGDDSLLPETELNCNYILKIKIESPDRDTPNTSDNQFDSNDTNEIEKEDKVAKKSKTRRTNVTQKKRSKLKGTYVKRKKLKSFDCLYCEVNNLSSSQMVAHCSDQHPGKQPLQCKICSKMFYHKKAYWNHKTKIHTKAKPVLDPDAKGNFISDDHDKDSNGNSFVPGFDIKDLFQIKIETPSEDAPSASNDLLDGHDDLSVDEKEVNINKKSTTVTQNRTNVKRSKLKNFDCFYCEVKCLSSGDMIAHCSDLHPGKESLKCKMCPKLFSNAQAYWNHKRKVHTNAKQPRDPNAKKEILCEMCGKAFLTKDSMATHRSTMHRSEVNVECDICHKTVRGKWNLKLHQQRHLGIKPHLCEECGMAFCSPQELREHVRVKHRGEKKRTRAKTPAKTKRKHPFQCLLCPYSFVQEIGLQKHMELHDPERKYECDECGLRFRTYDIRFAHIKIKHKKIKRKRTSKTPAADV